MRSGGIRDSSRDPLTDLAMNRADLCQERRGLSVESQHVDLTVDALGNCQDALIQGAAGKREFFSDPR